MSAGKGKRGPPEGQLGATSSSSSDEDNLESPRQLPMVNVQKQLPLDHDYDYANSPSGSSTASGGVTSYVRQPGFTHHAYTIRRPKKKKNKAEDVTVDDDVDDQSASKPAKHPAPVKNKPVRGEISFVEICFLKDYS